MPPPQERGMSNPLRDRRTETAEEDRDPFGFITGGLIGAIKPPPPFVAKKGAQAKAAAPKGLTSVEAAELLEKWGPNEIPVVEKTLLEMLLQQFTGTMAYILEICVIISAAVQDWPDFGVILAMLLLNAALGMNEQLKAKAALKKLTSKMISTVSTFRDGQAEMMPITQLVPGDAILLQGGNVVPADVTWIVGDVLEIDTAALTGEPLPRKYPSSKYGAEILSGSTVKSGEAYCVVKETGIRTEIGQGQAEIAHDRQSVTVSLFEQRVLYVVTIIVIVACFDALVICLVQGVARDEFKDSYKNPLLAALSVLIASVPIALPLVLQVTMAIGAANMAVKHHAIVTRMSALQDIASMSVLCSDKTGTITTAKMTINLDKTMHNIHALVGLAHAGIDITGGKDMKTISIAEQRDLVILLASLGANPAKVEDAIDSSVMRAFKAADASNNGRLLAMWDLFEKVELTGFNPEFKRTVATLTHKATGKTVLIAKGIASKILDTSDGNVDTAPMQWRCAECDMDPEFIPMVHHTDESLATDGYKTLALAVGVVEPNGKIDMHFLGLLPMLDPPRSDSAKTIHRLHDAGVEVKMVTGDHLNIARETARLVGLSTNIMLGSATRDGTYERDDLVRHAGGFAQVLPRDKRECVLILQRSFNLVVGMTGDGVNDAPALSAAECGIAVSDATDAAKNAAAMILTEEGLGAVFEAVVESRKIQARLLSYVSYRLATTFQVLISLTVIILAFNCEINTIYIVLLALFNDLTMLPIAEDNQIAAQDPMDTSVAQLVSYSLVLGSFQAMFTLFFFAEMRLFIAHGLLSPRNTFALGDVVLIATDGFYCNAYAQNAIWLQIAISAEMLIFVARSPGLFFLSRPSNALLFSTMIAGCVVCSLLSAHAFPGSRQKDNTGLRWKDIGIIWCYNIFGLIALDYVKLFYKHTFEHSSGGVLDEERYREEDEAEAEAAGRRAAGEESAVVVDSKKKVVGVSQDRIAHQRAKTAGRTPIERLRTFLSTGRHTAPSIEAAPQHYSQRTTRVVSQRTTRVASGRA